jgi:hypothetical protein
MGEYLNIEQAAALVETSEKSITNLEWQFSIPINSNLQEQIMNLRNKGRMKIEEMIDSTQKKIRALEDRYTRRIAKHVQEKTGLLPEQFISEYELELFDIDCKARYTPVQEFEIKDNQLWIPQHWLTGRGLDKKAILPCCDYSLAKILSGKYDGPHAEIRQIKKGKFSITMIPLPTKYSKCYALKNKRQTLKNIIEAIKNNPAGARD